MAAYPHNDLQAPTPVLTRKLLSPAHRWEGPNKRYINLAY